MAAALGTFPGVAAAEGVACAPEPTVMQVSYGDVVTCDIGTVGDVDTFRFTGAVGEFVSVQVARHGGLVPCVEIYDPDGVRLGGQCGIFGARVDAWLNRSGTYSIRVSESGNDEVGGYALDLQRFVPSPGVGSLEVSETVQGTLAPVGDVDVHTFSALAGDTMTVLGTRQGGLVVCVELLDIDGLRLGGNCNIFGARIDVTLAKTGTHTIRISESGNDETGGYSLSLQCAGVCPPLDSDGDGMSDACELQFGLAPLDPADAADDPDGDGLPSLTECANGTHPRGFHRGFFAEGATGGPLGFSTRLASLNPGQADAIVLFRFLKPDASRVSRFVSMKALTRHSMAVEALAGLDVAEFSTIWEADVPVIADRTMVWDGTGYGSHAETSVAAPSQIWYFAEGATHSGFQLFYLVQNPHPTTPATVTIEYLLPAPRVPVVRAFIVPPRSRYTNWVNVESALTDVDVSAVVTSTHPVIVERAMYLGAPGRPFAAGHESAGVPALSNHWFLAEGATGSYFDLFVLIANPWDATAECDVRFLLPDGGVISRPTSVPPRSRYNIWVDEEGGRLADTAVSTTISCGVPIMAERAMWWPGPTSATWTEAHNSPGTTVTGARWALAEGEVGGTRDTDTFILVANTSPYEGSARVTLVFEDGLTAVKTFPLAALSRFNVWVRAEFPLAMGRRFGAIIESLGSAPAELVVERAMYSDAGGVAWAAGTNAIATRLP